MQWNPLYFQGFAAFSLCRGKKSSTRNHSPKNHVFCKTGRNVVETPDVAAAKKHQTEPRPLSVCRHTFRGRGRQGHGYIRKNVPQPKGGAAPRRTSGLGVTPEYSLTLAFIRVIFIPGGVMSCHLIKSASIWPYLTIYAQLQEYKTAHGITNDASACMQLIVQQLRAQETTQMLIQVIQNNSVDSLVRLSEQGIMAGKALASGDVSASELDES